RATSPGSWKNLWRGAWSTASPWTNPCRTSPRLPLSACWQLSRNEPGMTDMARKHLIVVGSGIAGLYAALLAADAGAEVTLLSKGALADSNTFYAQGGISAVLGTPAPGDTVAAHIRDT